jgi:hypothetical protein
MLFTIPSKFSEALENALAEYDEVPNVN